jgi:hypothetical protein
MTLKSLHVVQTVYLLVVCDTYNKLTIFHPPLNKQEPTGPSNGAAFFTQLNK